MSRHERRGDRRAFGGSALLGAAALLIVAAPTRIEARAIRVSPPPPPGVAEVPGIESTEVTGAALRDDCVCDSTWADSTLCTLELPAATFAFGDTVRLVYRITNRSSEPITYLFPTTCQKWFAVYPDTCGPLDGGCTSAWEPSWFCGYSPTFFTLNPGESREFSLDWRHHNNDGYPVSLGPYTAWGALYNDDFEETLVSVPFEVVPYGPRVIQDALDLAAFGDSVVVAPGVYYENLVLHEAHDGVVLVAEGSAGETILDGGGRGSVIYAHDVSPATTIRGFTIRNGREADDETVSLTGGGISLRYYARPAIRNNIIRDNRSYSGGGITCHYGADAVILENLVLDNTASYRGGGIYVWFPLSPPIIRRNTFVRNSADVGGGVHATSPYDGITRLFNNIFYRNTAADEGGGMYCEPGNLPVGDICSAYWENVPDDKAGECANTDLVFEDPLFCDPDAGDFTLQEGSPCAPENNPECGLIGAFDVGCETISIAETAPTGPVSLSLNPNPFSRTVEVRIGGGPGREGGRLRLEMYTSAGRRIWSAAATAGEPLNWDGCDGRGYAVEPGVYFLRVLRGGKTLVQRKLVRLR
jgi:hypothetical protein